MGAHRGGALMLAASAPVVALDPRVSDDPRAWQLFAVLHDGLVASSKIQGGAPIVADLAEALPAISEDGRAYVFRLRQGVRFSDGREVTGRDAVASLRRMLTGAPPYVRRWFAGVESVTEDAAARTITIRLSAPDGALLAKLSTPFAAILPEDAPPGPPPGAGPYMVGPPDKSGDLVLIRNPHFREFSAEAQPDGFPDSIRVAPGIADEAAVTAILNGQRDWMFDDAPLDRLAELLKRRKDQVRIHPLPEAVYLLLDTTSPPFDSAKARQAVAFAADRGLIVKLLGSPSVAAPLCQILPDGVEGHVPYCPFTKKPAARWSAPDLDTARRLAKESGAAGQIVTLASGGSVAVRAVAAYLTGVLRDLGYDARAVEGGAGQARLVVWRQDYPHPSAFLETLFACGGVAGFCDQAIDAEMARAHALAAADPAAADLLWWEIDRDLTNATPAVALVQPNALDLLSSRVRNYVWSDAIGMVFSQAWVR